MEGLAGEGPAGDGELDPVQRSFFDNDDGQCGYCTPGFVLTAKALLEHNPHPTGDEIRQALAGNLCRCNAYGRILRSVKELAGGPSPADTPEPCPSPASA